MAGFLIIAGFQNCSDAKFSAGANSNGSLDGTGEDGVYRGNLNQPNTAADSCYTILHNLATDTKVLFVVDNSGSNFQEGNQPGSDPNKSVRGGSIQAFFNDFKAKQNFSWGFITFKSGNAYALINNGSQNSPAFSNLLPPMENAISSFMTSVDSGDTPYQNATSMARQAIQNDPTATASSKWIVVFMSDGKPNPNRSDNQLRDYVQSIMDLKPNQISFNTVYYGPEDPEAAERLKLMAQVGKGKFLDTNKNPSGNSFLISNIVNVPGMTACKM